MNRLKNLLSSAIARAKRMYPWRKPMPVSAVPPAKRPDPRCESFHEYLRRAAAQQMDVNEWIETELGWGSAETELNRLVVPYLSPNSRVCEIGPGTGRHARHLLRHIPAGELHLLDHSEWISDFLRGYFASSGRVRVHQSDGWRIQLPDASLDLCMSMGTFIEMKLGGIYMYAREFSRILVGGGLVVFDYIDIGEEAGLEFLAANAETMGNCFTYHTHATIDTIFGLWGFGVVDRIPMGKSMFAVYRKTHAPRMASPTPAP